MINLLLKLAREGTSNQFFSAAPQMTTQLTIISPESDHSFFPDVASMFSNLLVYAITWHGSKFEHNNLKYLKNNVNNARRKKVWLVEIMVCCGVICGADEKWCGVPFPASLLTFSTYFESIYRLLHCVNSLNLYSEFFFINITVYTEYRQYSAK